MVDDDGAAWQHIHLAFQQFGIRTETDAKNDHIRFDFALVGDDAADKPIFAFKSFHRLPQRQLDAMTAERVFDPAAELAVQIPVQNPVRAVDQSHPLPALLERLHQLNADVTRADHRNVVRMFRFFDDGVGMFVVFAE